MKKDVFVSVKTEIHWLTEQLYNLTLLPVHHVRLREHTWQKEMSMSVCVCVCVCVCVLWSRCVAARAEGRWLMKRCPLCHAEDQHIPALFTDLMHINHLTTSTYRHRIRSPRIESDNMVWTQRGGKGCVKGGRRETRPEIAHRGKCSASIPICQSVGKSERALVGACPLPAWIAFPAVAFLFRRRLPMQCSARLNTLRREGA